MLHLFSQNDASSETTGMTIPLLLSVALHHSVVVRLNSGVGIQQVSVHSTVRGFRNTLVVPCAYESVFHYNYQEGIREKVDWCQGTITPCGYLTCKS
mmetsp:Transcript_10689/g.15631  ORF Transcript_10689/g.15631 Transcript_10689/m.15631 type:complete len:97 (+) Transcript_10689:318-608(+)